MPIWSKFSGGLRTLLDRRKAEQEMDEELGAFLHFLAERMMRSGMSAAEAHRAARVEMGSIESVKEEIRGAGWESAVEALWTDVRYSVRILAKAPLFSIVVVLTLALGIGANTAIFSLINSLLLKTLPVEKPEELMEVSDSSLTNPLWEQIRDRPDVFSGVFAWGSETFDLAKGGMTRAADGFWVSGDLFRTLGLHPAAGRLLSASDDRRGCAALAVLSYGFWRAQYGAGGSAIGSTISLDGHPFEVIGVTPPGFYGMTVGSKFDIAVPICAAEVFDGSKSRLDRYRWWLHAAGRTKTGIGMAGLKSRLAAISPAIFESTIPRELDPATRAFYRKRMLIPAPLATGLSDLRKVYEEPLQVLLAGVGLVLLIACANIASLQMARAAARSKEMAMRRALGASRLRLMRQLIAECVLLSFTGAALGLLFARWGDTLLLDYLSGVHRQVVLDFALDARVLVFTAGAATITGLLFGVAPALRGTNASLTLSAFFGGLALLLATMRIYGTLSYLVAPRRIEFGIRMALGETSRSILKLVMRSGATPLIGGIATGIGLSLATSRLLSALLFGIESRDPGTIAMSGALIAAVSLAAGLLAARRATRVDPMVALREE